MVTSGLSAFYLDVASVGGTLTEFPMGSIFRRGGYLVDMETWTVDGGSGTGDYFALRPPRAGVSSPLEISLDVQNSN